MIEQISAAIVEFVHQFGYWGVFFMTFLEANFLPLTSEIALVPAGYLIYEGKMAFAPVFFASMAGLMTGAVFNYALAYYFGRKALPHLGKFRLVGWEKKLALIEGYFAQHGPISIFSGRLIPGVRHFISFPAGLSRMNFRQFLVYTTLGGAIWMGLLIGVGYFIGNNHALLKKYLTDITWVVVAGLAIIILIYIKKNTKPLI